MSDLKTQTIQNAYRFCPQCGHQSDEVGQIPFRCGECDFTFFFGPVAAVGGLIVNDEGLLLMVRRARDPGKGQWGLPGGFVDRGESIEEALYREVLEETQLKVTSQQLLTTGPNVYSYRGWDSCVVDLFYVCQVAEPTHIQLAKDELSEYLWCVPGPAELNNMAFPSNYRAVSIWLKSQGT